MRRIFRGTAEQVFGVYDTSSPAYHSYLPMDTANNFKPMTMRPRWSLQDPSGQNVARLTGSEVVGVQGKLTTRSYWESAQQWCLWPSRVNSGATLPWPNDQKQYDLASQTLDFGYTYDDDSLKRKRYLGCKVPTARFTCSNDPSNPFLNLDYDIIGSIPQGNPVDSSSDPDSTAFPDMVTGDYPLSPLTFQECVFSSYHTSANAVNNYFDRFSITITNRVKAYYDNSRFPNRIHCRGRTVTLSVHPLLQVATDARLKYEAVQTLGATTIEFTNPVLGGGNTTYDKLKFNFRSQSFLDSINEDMILDEDAYVEWSATAYLDTSAGDDFTITYTPGAP